MRSHRSRTADPVVTDPRGHTMGAWGLWLTLIILGTGLAGFASAALYLHTGQPAWPPEGIARPAVGRAALAVVLAAAGCVAAAVARRRLTGDARPDTAVALLVAMGLCAGAIASLAADLRAVPFGWDEHAYTSVYWILTLTAATLLGTSLLMLTAVLLQRIVGLVDAPRMLELDVVAAFLLFSTVGAGVLLFLVHWLPVVTTGGHP